MTPAGFAVSGRTSTCYRVAYAARKGGYVQVADARMNDAEGNFVKRAAAHIESSLRV